MIVKPVHKICFVAKDIFPLFGEANDIPFGGSEVKLSNLIHELTARDYTVSIICKTPDSFVLEKKWDGITIHSWKFPKQKRKMISSLLFYVRLWSLMRRSASDVFISQNANILIFLTALFCRVNNKKFIHWISHDFDTSGTNKKGMSPIDFNLYRIGARYASVTIVQTKKQKQEMKRNFSRDAFIIRNGHVILDNDFEPGGDKILWIGRLKKSKQPHIFLDLAEKMHAQEFIIAGSVDYSDPAYAGEIISRISSIRNVTFFENVPYQRMPEVYKQGMILVNTSTAEGFSNTFLEAWNYSLPVLSLNHDPDGCISKFRMGFFAEGSVTNLRHFLENLIENEGKRKSMGMNGKKYLRESHDIQNTTDEFIKLLTTFSH